MIKLENIIKEFPTAKGESQRVIDDISLHINQGEILGIIGRSGAGKSTLLRCINLLEPPTKGCVYIHDTDLTKANEAQVRKARQKMGMVFQHFNLLWNRTIYQNIQLPLEVAAISKKEWPYRVKETLNLVGLSEQIHKYPSQLSGGQKQRVGIARALVLKPELLLCDEITSALDPETTDSILDLLVEINKKTHITTVLITHEMDVIQKICHRAIVLDKGKIAEEGESFDLFAHPQHPTTRRFIRSIFEHDVPLELKKHVQNAPMTAPVLQLVYTGNKANNPTLSELIRQKNVNVNILHGRIEYIQNQPLGLLWVQIDTHNVPLTEIQSFLEAQDVNVEVISHV